MNNDLKVWKINDYDWYAAISFDEAVEYAIANGADKESIFTYGPALGGPLPMSEEELRQMTIGDADDGPNGPHITGWELLQQIAATDQAAAFFASTEW